MCLLCCSYHQLSLFSLKLMVGMHIHPLQWKVPRLTEEHLTVQRLKNTNTSSISDFICHLSSFSSYNTCATSTLTELCNLSVTFGLHGRLPCHLFPLLQIVLLRKLFPDARRIKFTFCDLDDWDLFLCIWTIIPVILVDKILLRSWYRNKISFNLIMLILDVFLTSLFLKTPKRQ